MKRLALILLSLLIVLPVSAQSRTLTLVSNVSAQLGGGRDLGVHCANLLFFGDTTNEAATGNGPAGAWVAPNSGAVIVGTQDDGTPVLNALHGPFAALFGPAVGAATVTPTGCVVSGGTIYLWYMEIISNAGHDFTALGGGLALSSDGGLTWAKHPIVPSDAPGTQSALALSGGYLYALGTESGRTGHAVVGRAPIGQATDREAWRWFDGAGFTLDRSAHAAAVIDDSVGEIGLCNNGAWLAAYMSPNAGGIVLRTAPSLTGPWSEAEMILPWAGPNHGTYSPQWTSCGREMLISRFSDYSVWRAVLT